MNLELHDYVGFVGAVAMLFAYILIQFKKLSADNLIYSLLNLISAFLMLFSLVHAWNLTAVIIEIAWGAISIFGIIKWYQMRSFEKTNRSSREKSYKNVQAVSSAKRALSN